MLGRTCARAPLPNRYSVVCAVEAALNPSSRHPLAFADDAGLYLRVAAGAAGAACISLASVAAGFGVPTMPLPLLARRNVHRVLIVHGGGHGSSRQCLSALGLLAVWVMS